MLKFSLVSRLGDCLNERSVKQGRKTGGGVKFGWKGD